MQEFAGDIGAQVAKINSTTELIEHQRKQIADLIAFQEGAKVCGWGVYCYDFLLLPITSYYFLLLPITPSVSCSCVDALNTPSSKFPLSPTVSRLLQPV